ncbi:hypothetical protein [Paenibacillus eucommiae]|uniref:Extracellular solute-binding protein n=1 Tax=Paenibacillus eucommiae TaxID=1355755 RepID=A0ABS4J0D7_9BACL|nr:hypothetical protein [Paenibacillus eucommiae]MBP1993304.1 hypothetical protein [Paenibacillus eucommiae]
MNRILKISLSVFAAAIVIGVGLLMFPMPDGFGITGNKNKDGAIVNANGKTQLHFFIPKLDTTDEILPEADFIRSYIEEQFQVDLTITWLEANHGYNTALSSYLISNNPPDLWLNLSDDDSVVAANNNTVADISFYLTPQHMPNYFRYWISEKELKEFQLPNSFLRAPVPYDHKSYRSYYIRKDWLDHLSLDVPTNYEQYVQVLQAFTLDDPDGNGLKDTYGFTTSGNSSQLSTDWPEFVKHDLIFPYYLNESGQLVDMQSDLRVEQVIEDLLHVIRLGVVDPDWFLNKDGQHIDKAIQGKAGVVLSEQKTFAFDSYPMSVQNRTKQLDPNAEWVPFNPFGHSPLRAGAYPLHSFVFSNMASTDQKIKMTEILNWLSSEEGFIMTHYGQENIHYKRTGSTITQIQPPKHQETSAVIPTQWQFFTPESPEVFGLTVNDPMLTARDQGILQFITQIPVLKGVGTSLTPPIDISVQTMRKKQNEFQTKLLFEERSAKNWPAYRDILMNQYQGNTIFKQYYYKIRQADPQQ